MTGVAEYKSNSKILPLEELARWWPISSGPAK